MIKLSIDSQDIIIYQDLYLYHTLLLMPSYVSHCMIVGKNSNILRKQEIV